MWWAHGPSPSGVQLGAATLLVAALLVMSPLHHLPLYIRQLSEAIAEKRMRLITVVTSGNDEPTAMSHSLRASVITIDFNPVRRIIRHKCFTEASAAEEKVLSHS